MVEDLGNLLVIVAFGRKGGLVGGYGRLGFASGSFGGRLRARTWSLPFLRLLFVVDVKLWEKFLYSRKAGRVSSRGYRDDWNCIVCGDPRQRLCTCGYAENTGTNFNKEREQTILLSSVSKANRVFVRKI